MFFPLKLINKHGLADSRAPCACCAAFSAPSLLHINTHKRLDGIFPCFQQAVTRAEGNVLISLRAPEHQRKKAATADNHCYRMMSNQCTKLYPLSMPQHSEKKTRNIRGPGQHLWVTSKERCQWRKKE